MMILRDIVKIENEKPEREEKGMGEVKQTTFRVDKETADKFRQFCMDAGMNQAQGFDHVMEVLEMDRAKEAVPGRATEIEEFERNIKAVMAAYPMRRKTPCFSYGDIRRVHRIYASN